jgi:surfeit locus 1 family protein
VPLQFANRSFAPRLFTTLLTIVLMAMLIALGFWQLRRAAEKRALFDAFARGQDATQIIDGHTPKLARYSRISARGHYDAAQQILIDNMVDAAGRAGYYVITPFALEGGGWVLVNRGWVPLGRSRAERPAIPASSDERSIRGRADNLPSPGIRMGVPAPLAPPYPIVAAFPTHEDLARLLNESNWTPAADLVLLDADQPDGFVRNWAPPGFPPLRHIGYAVQWFALALALLVIYAVTNVRHSNETAA